MIEYGDEDLLMLSGIQHITFCERQWALIHIEQQWVENNLTVVGNWLHSKVDNPHEMTKRNETVTLRSVPLTSKRLGLYGISDAVEMTQTCESNSIIHPEYEGKWHLRPIDYKKGKPKFDERDTVQLCAQAICLEEMYQIRIEYGYLFYWETRHREKIEFTDELRLLTESKALRMHELYSSQFTPQAIYKPHCRQCSLLDICMPKFMSKHPSVNLYLNQLKTD